MVWCFAQPQIFWDVSPWLSGQSMKCNLRRTLSFRVLVCVMVGLVLSGGIGAVAFGKSLSSETQQAIEQEAEEAWMDGAFPQALALLERGISTYPRALTLKKMRADIFSATRRPQEALEAYEDILKEHPQYLDVRWAKWGVLTRLGQAELAVEELQDIAGQESTNPLIHLLLAQELRKLDRLEESIDSFRLAIALVPELQGWRLSLARTLFDVLQYDEARKEVQGVLKNVQRGSPVGLAARNLLMVVYGATKERGRRFQPIFSPVGSAADRKRWAMIRPKAWQLFSTGRYREAEPILREALVLKPTDYRTNYELGSTLMELDQYEEAITFLQKGIELGPASDEMSEVFLDSIFRIGQCLTALEQWEEAMLHFEILQEIATVPPPNPKSSDSRDDGPISREREAEVSMEATAVTQSGKVIDAETLAFWVKKVEPHVNRPEKPAVDLNQSIPAPVSSEPSQTYYTDMAAKRFKSDDPLRTGASLMGRDADFSWFRFVMPAEKVIRDDLNVGTHEYIAVNPNVSFSVEDEEIVLVFALVTSSYDEVPLSAQCFYETSELTSGQLPVVQDQVIMAMSEQSGYFLFSRPDQGWRPGLYRCGLFVGSEATAYTQADEVRFRIIDSKPLVRNISPITASQ